MVTQATTTPFLDQYPALSQALPGAGLPWLAALRRAGHDQFAALGLPSHEVEDWKYTSLTRLGRIGFSATGPVADGIDAAVLPRLLPAGHATHRLVFVDGRLRKELSNLSSLPEGAALGALADLLADAPESVEAHLGRLGTDEDQAMLALNAAFMNDGFVLRLGRGVVLEAPIEILFVNSAGDGTPVCHPRNLVVAEAGSQATVIEHHVGLDGGTYLVNGVTEVVAEDGAVLRHYTLQGEGPEGYHLSNTQVRLAQNAVYDSFVLSLGGRLARNEIAVRLDGAGAECRLNGAYAGRDNQHVDNTTFVDHASPRATSRQTYKGVLDDRARAVFQGRVLVRRDAQKTDGHQLNQTLLLSDRAEIDSKPQLEIYADDVKCSHGATAGDLDTDALFYLQSRGIPEHDARNILVQAFLDDVVGAIGDEVIRGAFHDKIVNWLVSA